MTMEVLQAKSQIAQARAELARRGASFTDSRLRSMMRRFGIVRGVVVGDAVKSWDVLKTAEFIEQYVAKDAPVLDIGSYACELPLILHRLGYQSVAAVDLNTDIVKMPHAGAIDYRVGDFLRAPFPDRSFAAVTAISVIEHGFNGAALAAEVARLLKPGGFFIASFDYWPEKISTDGQDIFGMSWTIFSRSEVEGFLSVARGVGLEPEGELAFDAQERPVSCFGREYTFAWLVLVRK